jgi:hypothetical protein
MLLMKQNVALEMADEVRAMASHALSQGVAVPGWVFEILARVDDGIEVSKPEGGGAGSAVTVRDIHRAHSELTRLVAPFTPDLIVMLQMESNVPRFMKAIGQVRISRMFVLIVIASLVVFFTVSVSPYVNDPKFGDIFEASGWPLFVNEVFYLSSASVGASFASLFRLDRELCQGIFLPKDQSSYWVQYTLGVVAGLLLSTVLHVHSVAPQDDAAHTSMQFSGAALALMGGFSSSVVQRLIQRLIEALETILRGAADHEVRAREEAHKLRMEEQLAKDRMRTTLLLVDMQRQLGAGQDPEALRARLDDISQSVLTSGVPSLDAQDDERPSRASRERRVLPPSRVSSSSSSSSSQRRSKKLRSRDAGSE